MRCVVVIWDCSDLCRQLVDLLLQLLDVLIMCSLVRHVRVDLRLQLKLQLNDIRLQPLEFRIQLNDLRLELLHLLAS